MFVKRNRRRSGEEKCTSILLVHGERVREKRPVGRPRADAPPPKSRVVHRTIANLSKLPPELIALIESYCRGEKLSRDDREAATGPAYGPLAATFAIASELGIVDVLGPSRIARLALFLVLARVCHRGSRLSAAKWARGHAVAEILGLQPFDEDDLYRALDWLDREQERIEVSLATRRPLSTIYLYDVTSSYFEGQENEYAAPGYNRDGKRFKKQVVEGLLTDDEGEPIGVRLYPGNTSDPKTVADPVRLLAEKIGARDVVFVGDRGMLKSAPRETLFDVGFRFLTALTDAQVRPLVKRGAIQLELFEETPAEVEVDGRRLILRLNPDTRDRDRQRRADQLAKVRAKIDARNALVRERPRAEADASLRFAEGWIKKYKLAGFVGARLEGREVVLEVDATKRAGVELLDGCYVLETDVKREAMDTTTAVARYKDLAKVERCFRTMKTGLLELRPIFVRKAERTRGHALVTMLALKIVRALERRLKPTGLGVKIALDRLAGVRLLTFADPKLGLWHLPKTFAEDQREILGVLPPLPAPKLSRPKPSSSPGK